MPSPPLLKLVWSASLACCLATAPARLSAQQPVAPPANTDSAPAEITNSDITAMVSVGLDDAAILRAIRAAKQRTFNLTPAAVATLRSAGVSSVVITAMTDLGGGSSPAAVAGARASAVGLKILVIKGEDAVNIITQKTAVAPVVEVRDKNNLPVPGVAVVFRIPGGNATFAGGAREVTAISNAAGQASVTELAPIARGSLQIEVSATAQGETATATISQSNVPTAAEAKSLRSNSQQSVQAEAGGGMSKGVILAIVGGGVAAAAGAMVLTRETPCTFTVNPVQAISTIPGASTSRTFSVSSSPPDCSPATWTASSSSTFVTLTPSSGSGSGVVAATFAANPSGAAARSFVITIAGSSFTGTQNQNFPPCNSQQLAGANVPETRTIELGRTSGTFGFIYDTQIVPDRMVVSYAGQVLFDTGCLGTGGDRTQNLFFSGNTSAVTVTVTPNCSGPGNTAWSFTVTCPR